MQVDHRHAPETNARRGGGDDRRSQAADLQVGGEADPEVLAVLPRLRLLSPEGRVVDQGQGFVERDGVVARVVGQPEEIGVRLLGSRNKVLAPDLDRVEADLTCHQVHHALDQVGGFGPSRAAIRVGRGSVGENAHAPAVEGLQFVRSLGDQEGDRHEGAELGAIRPEVQVLRGADPEDRPVLFGGDFDIPDLGPAVMGGLHVFTAVFSPFHRPPQPFRGEGDEHFLRIDADLRPEAAADILGHDTYLALWNPQDDAQPDFDEVGDLRRRPDSEGPGKRLVIGQDAASLDRDRDQALLDEALGNSNLRLLKRRLHVAG